MSWKLARKDMDLLIRNPITYLGIILMIWIVFYTVSPFWNLYGNVRDEKSSVVYDSDGEIEDGYIPTPTEVVYQNVMQELREALISDCSLSEEAADKEIKKIQENEWSMDQIAQYFKDKYSLNGVKSIFVLYEHMWATKGEMDEYLGNVFHDRTYTKSFAYKYSEYLGIGSILFTVVIFALILARDLKKDMYALIHAKSLCGRNYIIGKMIAGVGFVYAVIIPLTFIINMIAMRVGKSYGFRVDFWDIWKRVIILDFPSILLTGCLMMFIALLFRSIMPATPALLLYFLYSNMGTYDSSSGYIYKVKPFALFVRFPMLFSELTMPRGALWNVCFACVLSAVLLAASVVLWERRRGG